PEKPIPRTGDGLLAVPGTRPVPCGVLVGQRECRAGQNPARKELMPADLVFLNGPIITVDDRRPTAEAVAVLGNIISRVCTADEVRSEIGPATRVVDLGGRALLPGLNDNHNHPISLGQTLRAIDATPTAAPTLAALQRAFREATSRGTGRDGWL